MKNDDNLSRQARDKKTQKELSAPQYTVLRIA
jgi:hypothetical protein